MRLSDYLLDGYRCAQPILRVLVFDLAKPGCSKSVQATRSNGPVRRPSGGAVERGVWQDAKRGMLGQGWPVLPTLGAVPERGNAAKRSNSRRLARRVSEANQVERSETRMSGALSLWLLSLLREQRESNSPRGEIDSESDRCAAVSRGPRLFFSRFFRCAPVLC
jgi:hypothetical protein